MNCSIPGSPVLQYLPEFSQTHVYGVSDAIQPSHSLSSPSPLVLGLSLSVVFLSQQESFTMSWTFASGDQRIWASLSVLPVNIQGWFPLGVTGLIALQSRESQESSPVSQFSHSVVCDCLKPHEPPHSRPPCPSPTPGVHLNSHPFSWWCHWTISASVVPFSSVLNLPQNQGLFQWVSSSHVMAKVLEFQL